MKQHAENAGRTRKPWWRLWLACAGGIIGLPLLAAGVLVLFAKWHNPFPAPAPSPPSAVPGDWWTSPPPLTGEEIAFQRWLSSVSWELPRERWKEQWNVGGRQYGLYSIRYQAAFAAYAAAALGMRTPAYPALTGRILESLIDHVIDRGSWGYIGTYWKNQPTYPDPCAFENVMFTGHLLQMVALHEAMTGDSRYRTEGFDLVWDDTHRFHYDTLSLVEVTVRQMRENESGGIACEPGLIFFTCNNHPQIALRLLEGMGLGDWSRDREKWETWALSSYRSVLGGGAIKLLYHLPTRSFIPRGHPGIDGWGILWFEPWVSDPAISRELWRLAVPHINWNEIENAPPGSDVHPAPGTTCCIPVKSSPAPLASLLAPAARMSGDNATAERLERWLDGQFRRHKDGKTWLDTNPEWRIAVTANRLLAMAIANGSDIRSLVLRPLPRDYFKGPLVADVQPRDVPVYQAYRSDDGLVVELDGGGHDVTLHLANVGRVTSVENIGGEQWSFSEGKLQLRGIGRVLLRIAVEPGDFAGAQSRVSNVSRLAVSEAVVTGGRIPMRR